MQATIPDLYKELVARFPNIDDERHKLTLFYPEATKQMVTVAQIVGNKYCDVRSSLGVACGQNDRFKQIQKMVIVIACGHTLERHEVFRNVVQSVEECLAKDVIDTYAQLSGYSLVWKEVDGGKLVISGDSCVKKACDKCPPRNDKFWTERRGKVIN